jgi:hypothetical protein
MRAPTLLEDKPVHHMVHGISPVAFGLHCCELVTDRLPLVF